MAPRLTPFAPELWFAEHDHYMSGLVHFRGRMTVVRLPDGQLWLHSPIPVDDALARELDALGPVGHLVAPNRLHHVHLRGVFERYPQARRWAAPGLADKRRDLAFTDTLAEAAPEAWGGAVELRLIEGAPWINEVVFFVRPAATVVLTDLVFNIHEARGLFAPLLLRVVGAHRRLAQSRLIRQKVVDRAAFARSGHALLAWDFERVLMAHGRPLPDPALEAGAGFGARAQLQGALAWMLAAPEALDAA